MTDAMPAYLPDFFISTRRDVPMGKSYAEVYGIGPAGQEKKDEATSIFDDPKSCFSSKQKTFARQWLRDHLPPYIAGIGGN